MLLSVEEKLAKELRLALMTNQLSLQFQPKVDVVAGKLLGAEVLLRWNHPTKGLIPADKWVAIAETNGLMRQLTCWLVDQTMEYLQKPEMAGMTLAINVSPTVFDGKMALYVIDALAKAKVAPSQLELEITESATVENLTNLASSVRLLQSRGVVVSLDDFGSGFATMRYLVEVPVKTVKIDKSFIQKAPLLPAAALVLRSLIELAREIGLSVVCEGVETRAQLNKVLNLGCTVIQGYLTGKPTDFVAFLNTKIEPLVRMVPKTKPLSQAS